MIHGVAAPLALKVHDLLHSLRAAELAPFLCEWPPVPAESAPDETTPREVLPVVRWLDGLASVCDAFGADVIAHFVRDARSLGWRRTYSAAEAPESFIQNYGYTELVGPRGPVTTTRIACGFLLLGPATLYPDHRHEAEEVYVPLSGTARWRQGGSDWACRPPGTLIHHASDEPHAIQTDAQPLLALYLWRSGDLKQRARLDAESR